MNNNTIRTIPIFWNWYMVLGLKPLPLTNSIKANRIKPPSRIGNGRRFMIKSEMLIIAKKLSTLTVPVEKPSANPVFAVSPSITVILTGPETAFVRSMPLNSSFKVFNVIAMFSPVCLKPESNAEKTEVALTSTVL